MSPSSQRVRRWLAAAVKVLLVALVAWGLSRALDRAVADLREQHWTPASLRPGWLVAAGLLYLAGMLPSALFWRRLLAVFGPAPGRGATLRAWYIGSLGKYVPGKALVIVLRTALLRPEGVGVAASTATIFYETLTTMAAGALVAGAILVVLERDRWELAVLAAGLVAVAGLPTVPIVFKQLARWAGMERAAPGLAQRLDHLPRAELARAWLSIAGGWCLVGLSVWATLQSTAHDSAWGAAREIALSIACGALAVVAGFVSFIPGGLVVRDAVILALLSPAVGAGPALVCALLARLVWLLSEVLISIILYPLGPRFGPSDPRVPAPPDR